MELSDVVKEIEEDELNKDKIKARQLFKSMLNQPSLLSINSANAVRIGSQEGFSSFSVDLPRSVLDIDSLQLLTTSIPQCNPSLPNTALVFWYYRLSQYTGTTPSLNNLYCVRLLPSYYKPEFINNPDTYGFNTIFSSYPKLSDELTKSCARDLGYSNLELLKNDDPVDYEYVNFPILPGDISITYNPTYKKFQMTGNTTRFAIDEWSSAITYVLGDVIYNSTGKTYTSLQNANTNNNPTNSPAFWKRTQNEIVAGWKDDTLYIKGNLVLYENNLVFRARGASFNIQPPNATFWENYSEISPAPINYNYLITGYDDPNVLKRQGETFRMPYNPNYYYQTGERVFTDRRVFQAITETSAFTPGNVNQYDLSKPIVYYEGGYRRRIPNAPIQSFPVITPNPTNVGIWSPNQTYEVGDLAYDGSLMFRCLVSNTNARPIFNINTFWILEAKHPYDATTHRDIGGILYNIGDCAVYQGQLWVSNLPSVDNPAEPFWTAIGRIAWLNYNYNSTEVYEEGEIIYFNGAYYRRNGTDANTNPPVPIWNATTYYAANVTVRHVGGVYRCVSPNVNVIPTDAQVWEDLGVSNWDGINMPSAEISGLGGLSNTYDFVERYQNTELVGFPAGIQGQPFSRTPKRLLNSILGFTWNGIFIPTTLSNLPTNETSVNIQGRDVTLYNKLRPVPVYQVVRVNAPLELEDTLTATATRTYTAEGYANLVYSSIINIYTDVVSASTLDTMRNTNLVATTTMNCGNLGIAFHASYIDTPLVRVVGGDIDTLVIELRDEMDDPFFLTNNAVMTATFKINYRNRVRAE